MAYGLICILCAFRLGSPLLRVPTSVWRFEKVNRRTGGDTLTAFFGMFRFIKAKCQGV